MSGILKANDDTGKAGHGVPGISSDLLKLIALVTMAIDHTGVVLFPQQSVWRIVGRIAFPLFSWLLVQGFLHTSNRRRYLGSMAVFALISEIPFDLAVAGRLSLAWQNVYFTLLLGLLLLTVLEKLESCPRQVVEKPESRTLSVLAVIAAMAAAQWLHFDYGCSGPVLIAVFYWYARRSEPALEAGFLLFCLSFLLKPILCGQALTDAFVWKSAFANMEAEFFGILAIPLIRQYNGVRKLKRGKYVFYWFYPAHLLLLYAVSRLLMPVGAGIL